jgi:hypothetical protein
VKAVDDYLRDAGLWDAPSMHTYVAIESRPEVERAPSKSVLSIVRDLVERPGPQVHIITLRDYEKKTVADIVGHEFDDLILVNFQKIREAVDREL